MRFYSLLLFEMPDDFTLILLFEMPDDFTYQRVIGQYRVFGVFRIAHYLENYLNMWQNLLICE